MMRNDIESLLRPGMGMTVVDEVSPYDWAPWNGRLLIYEPPQRGETYAAGVDPAYGVGGDNSVCQILKVGNLHHPDVQVAEFACNFLDPTEFANVVATIGRFYSEDDGTEAFMTVESNAECGDIVVSDLKNRLDYTNLFIWKRYDKWKNVQTNFLGWVTNRNTRPKLIARGTHAIIYGDLLMNSTYLLDEWADFKQDHYLAKVAARSGCHDDRVMAFLIAYWGAHDEEWLAGEDLAEERRLRKAAGLAAEQVQAAPISGKADYQGSALTYDQMMRDAEDRLFGDA